MLYDPKWNETTTKPDVFSLQGLIAWLEKQPADRVYCYADTGHCLLAQYFVASGFGPEVAVGAGNFSERVNGRWGRCRHYSDALDDIAVKKPRTFGAALERARKAVSA